MYRIYLIWHNYWWQHYARAVVLTIKQPEELRPDNKYMTELANRHYKMAQCYEAAIKEKRGKRKWLKRKKTQK